MKRWALATLAGAMLAHGSASAQTQAEVRGGLTVGSHSASAAALDIAPAVSFDVVLNEINTIPGFTEISQFPKLWRASGVDSRELLDRLIDLALERHADRRETSTSYD